MLVSLLASSRAMFSCACAALAAVGGCAAAGSSSVTVSGDTLKIYASAPAQAPDPQLSQDVLDAERLAWQQQGGAQIGRFSVRLITLNGRVSDNARRAIEDTGTIAYLGEIAPGTSDGSLGITNAQDVLQVSPTDTAIALTQSTSAAPGAPGSYYESLSTYGRTFARVAPSSVKEARAQLLQMRSLGVRRLYVADDGSAYGRAIALAVRADATSAITVVSAVSSADAMFYGASSASAAARAFNAALQTSPSLKLFGPSAIDGPALASSLSPQARSVYVSAPGFLARDLTPAGRKFMRDFEQAYGRAPGPSAIFGYEAMAAVLAVLHEAGSAANDRSRVVRDFFAIRNRPSVLGTYSIDNDGDTSLAPFVFGKLTGGALRPYKFVQVQS
jgi:branched-chain amino acid transport system substrate-binding protein